MKFTLLAGLALIATIGVTALTAAAAEAKKKPAGKADASKPAKGAKSQLLHVVSFKFKDATTQDEIHRVEEAFRALKTKIPQIKKLVWGLNNSPEGLNKGCTHVWVLTFAAEADRDAYLVHPDHKEFGKLVGPLLGDVFVADFWTKE
jgi:hypothetical protein